MVAVRALRGLGFEEPAIMVSDYARTRGISWYCSYWLRTTFAS
jgi:hypothetical protein